MWFVWRELIEKKTQLLVEQSSNLSKISYRDLDRRRVAKELQEELENATPKLFGDGFNFTSDFVGRLKTFVSDVGRSWSRRSIKMSYLEMH